jgi:hypothetical protein
LAHVRWFSLDGRLAAGEDPTVSPLLAARAARLTRRRHRDRLAASLYGLVLAAGQAPRISRISPARAAVIGNADALRELASRLQAPAPVYAGGVGHLERLLSDATGPAYSGGPAELAAELRLAESELDGASPVPADAQRPGRSRRGPLRRLARLAGRERLAGRAHAPGSPVDPPGFAGNSFALPGGTWFHGRRESA